MVDLHYSDSDLAALYDAVCPRAERSDFDFYLPFIMAAPAVLDLGCGTGALLREARQAGHAGRLCGLDPAAGMIAQAQRHASIEWVQGDLGSAGFRHEFDLIVMTGHAFQAVVEDEEIRALLGHVRAALAAEGRFAFETRNPAAREWEGWDRQYAAEVEDSAGRPVTMACRVETPFDGRTVSFTQTFTNPAWAEPRVSWSTLRFLDADALAAFLAEAGLAVEAQFGDWDRSPVTERSPEIITVTRPA
ncbi:class I SAM-dependent methyltransferase [Inquilinus limosus]|uniref:class I SAM-dependent methyltransferase n=1 Tax=Inquilinus limosus TaxID=171674 RepID=UPI00040F14BE|nr:class I SAM-dependent methyltransferase [Inquilinus limosus]